MSEQVWCVMTVNQTADKPYYLFDGYAHLAAGLSCGLAGLAAGMAIGIVGDAGVRYDHVSNTAMSALICRTSLGVPPAVAQFSVQRLSLDTLRDACDAISNM